jgi:PAS domain S-box-containing protein
MESPIRILVVDDDLEVVRATCRTLEQAGYATLTAVTGAQVLPVLRAQPAQLVLLDRQLPEVDGLEICRQIKADPALAEVLVVIVSGVHTDSEARIAGLEAQADGYIERPLGNRELRARVAAFVRLVRLNQALSGQAETLRVQRLELELQNEELRRAQAQLVAERARYFDLYDLAPVGYVTLSEPGLILEANLAAAGLLGVARGVLLGQPLARFILLEDAGRYHRLHQRLLAEGTPQAAELRVAKSEGTPCWAHLTATAAQDAAGAPVCRVVLSDITANKQAEVELRESHEVLRGILNVTRDGFWRVNARGALLEVNPRYVQQSGYTRAELLRLNITDLDPQVSAAFIGENSRRTAGQGSDQFETIHRRKDGTIWHVEASVTCPADARGDFFVFLRDITERKQAQAALAHSAARHQSILQTAMDGFWLVDPEGRLLEVNETYCQMSGYRAPELLAMRVVDLEASEAAAATAAHLQRIIAQGADRFESRHRRKDGSVFEVEVSVQYQPAAGGPFVSFLRDITVRKQAESALRQSEERFRLSMEATSDGLWDWNIQTGAGYFSPGYYRMLGYELSNFAMDGKAWQALMHPDDRERSLQANQDCIAGRSEHFEVEFRLQARSGAWCWILGRGKCIERDAQGRALRLVGTHMDITARKQAEAALRESEATFRALADTLPLAIYLSAGVEQVSEYVSPTMVKLFGYTKADIPCVTQWWPLAYPEETYRRQVAAEWTRRVEHSLATQSPIEPMETVVTCKDGSQKYVAWGFITLGQKNYAFGLDLTERKRAEQAVNREQALSKAIIDSILGAFYVLDETGHYVRWNAYQRDEILGQPEARVAGMDMTETIHPDDRALVRSKMVAALGRGLDETVEGRVLLRGGPAYRWLLMTGRQVMIEGRPFLVGIGIDITERKQAEAALRERFKELTCLYGVSSLVALPGIALDEMLDQTTRLIPPGWQFPEVTAARVVVGGLIFQTPHFRETPWRLAGEVVVNGQLVGQVQVCYLEERPASHEGPFLAEERALLNAIAERLGLAIERKQSEAALRASEARFRAVTDSATDAIISADSAGHIVGWNRGAERIFGYTEAEVRGQSLTQLLPFRYQQWHLAGIARLQAEGERHVIGKTVEVAGCHRDGHEFPLELSLGEWQLAEGRFFTAIIRDISTRKAAEEKVRELSMAVEQSPVSIVITDPVGNIEYVNPKFMAVTGYTAAEVLGQNPRVLKSGETSAEGYRELWQTITDGREWRGEFHNRKKSGELFWESVSISPIRDPVGRITRFVAVKEDITARKQAEAERSRMEVQLRQAQKLESIGQLAAGIAHEINTPTQYIGDNTRFLQDAFKDISQALGHYERLLEAARQQQVTPELVAATTAAVAAADLAYLAQEVPKSIEQTLQGVARVAKIVRAMKDFSHPGSEEKVQTDLNQAIESTVTVAHNEWKYVADLDLALDPQLPRVPCLPGEINQVILNLVINAAHAIGDVVGDGASGKGRIHVSTSRQGDWAEIRVQDTGTGIPESARARIFDPFFTTKVVGKGTGQGLTIAHSVVVQQHGGTIEFETELGKGTTFLVRLPLQPGPAAQARSA